MLKSAGLEIGPTGLKPPALAKNRRNETENMEKTLFRFLPMIPKIFEHTFFVVFLPGSAPDPNSSYYLCLGMQWDFLIIAITF